MGWLRRWQIRQAAKQYARRLGPNLRQAYGSAEHYSPAQIRTGVGKLGLDERYIAIAYAAFLSPETFETLAETLSVGLDYDEARAVFHEFRPTDLRSIVGTPGPDYAATGYPGDSC
ncbi:MAG: hypothetical protein JO001_18035 [Alphaproteobacteria bacterium]|nr:hypothetical protein [Alphaproteobacteria bacterium]